MSTDSFTQPQREALINILVLGMYSDNHLSLAEDEALNRFVDAIGWESGTGRTVFVNSAIARCQALSTEQDFVTYIQTNAAAFSEPEAKAAALQQLTDFLKVDGISPAEAPFLATFSQVLS
jgi:hypothetical protein